METVLVIWNFLTMLSIIVYGIAFLVYSEKPGRKVKSEVLFRGCLTILAIGIVGMLIITAIAFI